VLKRRNIERRITPTVLYGSCSAFLCLGDELIYTLID